jgi:anti-anti-sigma factor
LIAIAMPDQPLPGAVTLFVSGEIDGEEADQLCDVIVACSRPAITAVVIDLTDVTFFGSSGISALIGAKRILAERHLRLIVDGCSDTVRSVLQITGVGRRPARATSHSLSRASLFGTGGLTEFGRRPSMPQPRLSLHTRPSGADRGQHGRP